MGLRLATFGGSSASGLAGTRSPVVEAPRPVALPHPFFFEGRCRSPRMVADLLLALAHTVNSRFYLPGAWRMLDPVVTSSEELLRLEGFSSCCGVYARVDLSAEAFDSEIQGRGTTNVDFNAPITGSSKTAKLAKGLLARTSPADPVQWRQIVLASLRGRLPRAMLCQP